MARRALDRAFRDENLPTPEREPLTRERCLSGLRAAEALASGPCWPAERRGWLEIAQRWRDRLDRLDEREVLA